MSRQSILRVLLSALAAASLPCMLVADEPYDPLRVSNSTPEKFLEVVATDDVRDREIPLRVYLPSDNAPAPVVFFSHGLGGCRDGSAFLGKHWAQHGYVAVFVQHPGSDDAIWRSKPFRERMDAMRKAANTENFMLRVKDIPAVIDQLERWNVDEGNQLKGRMDLTRIGMSGHSFGAVTTQAVSGQWYPVSQSSLVDPRIKAAIAFSPSPPRSGIEPKQAFGQVKIPWMLMTGTKDTSPIGGTDVKDRLSVFPALPPTGKYELVLDNAEHSAFTERRLPGDKEQRNPNHYRVIRALSTAYWDAYLRDDTKAKDWLNGDGPKSVLEPGDRWTTK